MDEEILENIIVENENNDESTFPLFQHKQVAEFIKNQLGEQFTAQKAFRDKFNRCLSLFVFYLSHMVTITKEQNRKKKNEKIKQQVTKEDIIKTLRNIDFTELADELENLSLLKKTTPIQFNNNNEEKIEQTSEQKQNDNQLIEEVQIQEDEEIEEGIQINDNNIQQFDVENNQQQQEQSVININDSSIL